MIGAESMFVFHDVLQIEEAEAQKVENWVVRVLTQAALLESRTHFGRVLLTPNA